MINTVKGYNVMEQKDLKSDFLNVFSNYYLQRIKQKQLKVGLYL